MPFSSSSTLVESVTERFGEVSPNTISVAEIVQGILIVAVAPPTEIERIFPSESDAVALAPMLLKLLQCMLSLVMPLCGITAITEPPV